MIIDKGLTTQQTNRNCVDGLKIVGITGQSYGDYFIKGCFGLYIENCKDITIDSLDMAVVYGAYIKNSSNIHIKKLVINKSWIGLKLLIGVSNCTFDYVESNYANDLDPVLTSPNGDGITVDNSNCLNNHFGIVRNSFNADSGIDQQGIGTIIDDYNGIGNVKGVKLWGQTLFKKFIVSDSKNNSILAISGDHIIEQALLTNSVDGHIKMGLSAYATSKKKLTITGVADRWPSFQKDSNSTLIASITIGTSLPIEDYKKMYDELLVKYDALRADLVIANTTANTQASQIILLQTELNSVKTKLDQIKTIVG